WIMKDPELLEIATTRPRNAQQLSAIRNISSVTLKRNSRLVLELTNAEPLAEPPNRPVPELEPGQRALLKRLQKMVNDKSEVLALSARFLANKNDLVELIQYKQGRAELSSSILEGWRYDLVGAELEKICE
ncbi:MAG: HRDC domain-containing protein, partial [Pseudomonadales bacterium]